MTFKTRFAALTVFLIALFGANSLLAAPGFVQSSYKCPAIPTQVIKVTFPAAQVGTDLNVVVVGWTEITSSVVSVADANNIPPSLSGRAKAMAFPNPSITRRTSRRGPTR
jgi:hypothetical protein